MAILKQLPDAKRVIDLRGPEGNAYWLLGFVAQNGKELDYSKEEIKEIQDKMMSGDYENLVKVFDEHFGDLVDVVMPQP